MQHGTRQSVGGSNVVLYASGGAGGEQQRAGRLRDRRGAAGQGEAREALRSQVSPTLSLCQKPAPVFYFIVNFRIIEGKLYLIQNFSQKLTSTFCTLFLFNLYINRRMAYPKLV
jgi:hypothetical protein